MPRTNAILKTFPVLNPLKSVELSKENLILRTGISTLPSLNNK